MSSLLTREVQKKKKKIVNTGQEDLSANLGCDWCECEQFES